MSGRNREIPLDSYRGFQINSSCSWNSLCLYLRLRFRNLGLFLTWLVCIFNRPAWQPPSAVIGLIWPYNFTVLGIAAYQVSRSLSKFENVTWLIFFGLSVIAALIWAYQFYVPHNFLYASTALTLTAVLTIPVLVLTFRASLTMGLLLVPYQIWVAVAASLAWGYLARN